MLIMTKQNKIPLLKYGTGNQFIDDAKYLGILETEYFFLVG